MQSTAPRWEIIRGKGFTSIDNSILYKYMYMIVHRITRLLSCISYNLIRRTLCTSIDDATMRRCCLRGTLPSSCRLGYMCTCMSVQLYLSSVKTTSNCKARDINACRFTILQSSLAFSVLCENKNSNRTKYLI